MPKVSISVSSGIDAPIVILTNRNQCSDNLILAEPEKFLTYVNKVLLEKRFAIHSQMEYDGLTLLSQAKEIYPRAMPHMQSSDNRIEGHRLYSILNGTPTIFRGGYNPSIQITGEEDLSWVDELELSLYIGVYLPRQTLSGSKIHYYVSGHERRSLQYPIVTSEMIAFGEKFASVPIQVNANGKVGGFATVIEGTDDQMAMTLLGMNPSLVMQPVNEKWCVDTLGKAVSASGFMEAMSSL